MWLEEAKQASEVAGQTAVNLRTRSTAMHSWRTGKLQLPQYSSFLPLDVQDTYVEKALKTGLSTMGGGGNILICKDIKAMP